MSFSESSERIISGLWKNYDLPDSQRTLILVTDSTAFLINNLVAISLALTLPRLLILVKLMLPFWKRQYSRLLIMLTILRDTNRGRDARPRRVYHANVPNTAEIEMPQLPTTAAHSGHGSRIANNLATTFNDSSSFEDAAARYVRMHLFMNRLERRALGLHWPCIFIDAPTSRLRQPTNYRNLLQLHHTLPSRPF